MRLHHHRLSHSSPLAPPAARSLIEALDLIISGRLVVVIADDHVSSSTNRGQRVVLWFARRRPWESADGAGTEALTTSWVSPDPLHDGGNIFYSEITALYTNGLGNLIYFEGTDPREPGVPNLPPVVGTPREQFEEGLTVGEWHAYMDIIGQHNM